MPPLAVTLRLVELATAPENGVNGSVHAAVSDGNMLYVAGDFTIAGGVRTHRIARWNGLEWSALATDGSADLNGAVRALAPPAADSPPRRSSWPS